MIGLDRHTARPIGQDAHLAQSVHDILMTPKGSLVTERRYGSDLPDLLDNPINGETKIDLYQATAEALDRWEPRIRLERVSMVSSAAGRVELQISARGRDGQPIVLDLTLGLSPERQAQALVAGGAA
ncbi:hypothetical protein SAMN05421853_102111 [Roseivivax halotolerans]|uniref:IraD/Gp25-like domain-containing protein n=1 Tax=Roseivivax halotolerans TaxID=93684 RepID=A0A1I5W3Y1_9RHOB|nr:GPW/gp25 family protein [Roseivivax halotolerans]SFQ14429.1 hypothetical protein SAMN05421853_102111 [Roseivivax halotolerans]